MDKKITINSEQKTEHRHDEPCTIVVEGRDMYDVNRKSIPPLCELIRRINESAKADGSSVQLVINK